ncbi:DUF2066 domain-containing protein [Marinomonas sp. IMCC 4694]|uniref:DUF2066 domain-containing protein n=1 Tax=Marinomonas sp. IMCC 4694 TaxID=2605432 RepID=UPI0011E86750|nr:DUF2066 domain-containing protein [Marinomonas sp. IMCC 4694]TYL48165.1 DUF2066 domain-containing protein [Marinomonas sp. IMCC 4694]
MKSHIFIFLIGFFWIPLVGAIAIPDLYSADIKLPVAASEAQMLNEAFGLAVEAVLVKVSGDKGAIVGKVLNQAKKNAPTWVAQHSIASLSDLLPSPEGGVPGKQVKVTFYQTSIDQFLSDNNLPVWGQERPSVLIWLAAEINGVRVLSGSNAPSVILNEFAQSASELGVPIYAPLLDEVDKNSLAVADVWGFFGETIAKASRRYQTDAVAALRVSDFSGQVSGNLLVLLSTGESVRFALMGQTHKEIVEQASVKLAKLFSSKYASVRNGYSANALTLQITGVTGYGIMRNVQSYLESISVVRDVLLVQVGDEKIEFLIEIDGDKQKLFNSISLSALLKKIPINALDPDANRVVKYQYSGD